MFSELHQYPSYEVRVDTVDPVPKFIPRNWRGQQGQRYVSPGSVLKKQVLLSVQLSSVKII